jgi:hypothetical protein
MSLFNNFTFIVFNPFFNLLLLNPSELLTFELEFFDFDFVLTELVLLSDGGGEISYKKGRRNTTCIILYKMLNTHFFLGLLI